MSNDIKKMVELTKNGIALYNDGNYEDSLEMFEETLIIFPDWLIGLQYRAMCKIKLSKNLSEAQKTLTDLEIVAPTLVHVILRRVS